MYIESQSSAMDDDHIIDCAGKEALGGGTSVGLTATLLNALLAFEARSGPTYEQCNVSGGNLVALEADLITYYRTPISPTAFTQVVTTASSSTTSQELSEIQRMSFDEAVWVDVTCDQAGTDYPSGNSEYPVNNIPDAVSIAVGRGFRTMRILEDMELGVGDNVDDFKLIGVSHVNTQISILDAASTLRTAFEQLDITGVLDGESELNKCTVTDLTYFNGHIHNSSLNGTITLAGSLNAKMTDCDVLDVTNPPTINAGGSGQDLTMPNFSGVVIIDDLTGASTFSIGLDAGQVIINSSCDAGSVIVSGTGSVVDNSPDSCYVIDNIVNGTDVQNLSRLIEMTRKHHTGTGDIWFWDPANGSDVWDGKHADRATKTFAHAHSLATDNNHDIIMCVAGDLTGSTVTNEELVITKNYLFVRGPGRDFHIHNNELLTAAVDIQGNGVELSGMIVTTGITNSNAAITTSGSFPYLVNLFIEDSANGIHLADGDNSVIENVRISHGTGFGVKYSGTAKHSTLTNSHIGSNTGSGVIVDFTTGHEVNITNDNVIHGNGGYGVEISATSGGVRIGDDTSIYSNSLGDVSDLASDTYYETTERNAVQATAVWDHQINGVVSGSMGEVQRQMAFGDHIHINVNDGLPGTDFPLGTHSHPVNNMADALTIGIAEGIKKYLIEEDVVIQATDDVSNTELIGAHANKSQVTFVTGCTTDLTQIENSYIVGALNGSVIIRDSIVDDITGFAGILFQTSISGSVTVAAAPTPSYIFSCYTEGDTPIEIDLSVLGSQCHIRDYHGGIKVVNKSGIESMTIGMAEGKVILDGTVTNGSFIIAGNALLIDGSTGTTIDDTALLNSAVNLIQIDVTNIIDIITIVKKFDTNRTLIDETTFTLTVFDDDLVTPMQVYDLKDRNGVASINEIFERVPQ